MERISKSSRYLIDIIGTDPFSLEELGGMLIWKKLKKIKVFLT